MIPDIPLKRRVYASAPTNIIVVTAMRITGEAFDEINIVQYYQDLLLDVDGQPVLFEQGQITYEKPENASGAVQSMKFGFAGVSRQALKYAIKSIELKKPVYVELLEYALPDGESPVLLYSSRKIEVVAGRITSTTAEFQAMTQDLLNRRYPRQRYTPQNAPGIKYIS